MAHGLRTRPAGKDPNGSETGKGTRAADATFCSLSRDQQFSKVAFFAEDADCAGSIRNETGTAPPVPRAGDSSPRSSHDPIRNGPVLPDATGIIADSSVDGPWWFRGGHRHFRHPSHGPARVGRTEPGESLSAKSNALRRRSG